MRTLSLVFLVLLSVQLGGASHAEAENPAAERIGAFRSLDQRSSEIIHGNQTNGWAYLISGGLALGISVPAYYLSDDVFAKAVYSVTETISVASFGYGAYLLLVDDDLTRFVRIVKGTPGLTDANRDRLATLYLQENANRARNLRKIRVISHGLTAALNFVNAATSSQADLTMALYFLGGVNTLAAFSFAVSKSEEEKAIEANPTTTTKASAQISFFAGPVSGVRIRF